jgi:hypothetical protein
MPRREALDKGRLPRAVWTSDDVEGGHLIIRFAGWPQPLRRVP